MSSPCEHEKAGITATNWLKAPMACPWCRIAVLEAENKSLVSIGEEYKGWYEDEQIKNDEQAADLVRLNGLMLTFDQVDAMKTPERNRTREEDKLSTEGWTLAYQQTAEAKPSP